MVCTRSMQLTMTKTSTQFKSLDGNLTVFDRDTNTRESIGSKCADLDALMPTFLGASKSILDHVIFCHQEDSQWPLAEPSVVKKRFDEIFEATKFTKMLEDIKKMKKDITVEIKLQKQQALHLKTDSERAAKKREKMQQLESAVENYRQEAQQLKFEMDEALSESNRLFARNQKFQEVLYALETLRHSHSVAENQREKLYVEINQLDQGATFTRLQKLSDANIKKEADEFALKTSSRKAQISEMKEKLEGYKKELDNLRRQLNQQTMKEGQLKSEKDAYEKVLNQRKDLVKELINKKSNYPVGSSLDDLHEDISDSQLKQVIANLDIKLSNELEKIRLQGQQAEHEIEVNINGLTTDKLRFDQKILMLNESAKETEASITKLEQEIYESQSSLLAEGSLDYEETELQKLADNLQKYRSEYAEIQKTKRVEVLGDELRDVDNEIEKLQNYNSTLARDASNRARLDMLRNDLQRKESVLEGLIKLHEKDITAVLGPGSKVEPESLEQQLSVKVSAVRASIDKKQSEVTDRNGQISEVKTLLSSAKDDLNSKKQEQVKLKETLEETLPDFDLDNYEKELNEMEEAMQTAARNKEQSSFTSEYYSKAISFATSEHHNCLLCQRPFEDVEASKKFVAYLNKLIGQLPVSPEQAIQEYEEVREDYNAMKALSPDVQRLKELTQKEITEAESKISSYEEDLEDVRESWYLAKDELQTLKDQLSELDKLMHAAGDITRACKEVETLKTDIAEEKSVLEAGLESQATTFSQSLSSENVSERLSELNHKSRTLRAELSKVNDLSNELQINISNTQSRISAKTLKISQKKNKQKEVEITKVKLEELKQKLTGLNNDISDAKKDLEQLQPYLDKESELLAKTKFENVTEERQVNQKISEVRQYLATIEGFCKSVEEYEAKGTNELLVQSQKLIGDYTDQITAMEKEFQEKQEAISYEETSLADIGGQERALKDSLEMRRLDRELNDMERRISEYEKENAESSRSRYEEESKRLQNKYTSLNSSYSSRMGEIKQIDDQIRQLQTELNTEFKDIDEQLRTASCQLDVQQNVDSDLVGWGRAVDRAMMAFHKANMDRINEIIGSLWASAYTGTDVETILIKADSEAGRSMAGRASYNYRVCMVKQGVELDMRGRCSAGQKVLACIVIRLALAQCFGSRCGVITLDEPTTNLDSKNIEALARSLSAIIKSRNTQRNFQLIVITHDEEFLRQMHASDFTDHFFRVSRGQNQSSQIKFHHIRQISSD